MSREGDSFFFLHVPRHIINSLGHPWSNAAQDGAAREEAKAEGPDQFPPEVRWALFCI